MIDFEKRQWRTKFEAWILDADAEGNHETWGERKQAAIGSMRGTVVELGPGTGVNMRYYAPGVKVIAIEPNPGMHAALRAKADEHGVDIEIRTLVGEAIDVGDGEADGVVGTLLLCGVDDAEQVIREAHRVLKPGGNYFFIEHVAAPEGTRTARMQRVLMRPHRWLFNGCNIRRSTGATFENGPFEHVELSELDRGRKALWVRYQIVGTAQK